MFYQNWQLSLIALIMIPLASMVTRTLGKRIKKVSTEAQESSGLLNTYLIEIFKNHKLIKIFQKETYETSRADKALEGHKDRAKKLQEMCESLNLREDQFIVRHRYLPPEENFGINLTNRGGTMENAGFKIGSLKKSICQTCFYPSYDFFLDYNGDVLMCPHDWGKKII